jgi:hypothetical protein
MWPAIYRGLSHYQCDLLQILPAVTLKELQGRLLLFNNVALSDVETQNKFQLYVEFFFTTRNRTRQL